MKEHVSRWAWVKTSQLCPSLVGCRAPRHTHTQHKSLVMNKTTNGNNTYYSPNHDLTINSYLAILLTNSPLDFNNNINTIILNTETL